MATFHSSRLATATFLRQLPTRNTLAKAGLFARPQAHRQQSTSAKQYRVTLSGETLYIEKDLAEALGWTPEHATDGVPLRLSGWAPCYFAITQKGTDADLLACSTIESSRNPTVQGVLEHLKRTDSE